MYIDIIFVQIPNNKIANLNVTYFLDSVLLFPQIDPAKVGLPNLNFNTNTNRTLKCRKYNAAIYKYNIDCDFIIFMKFHMFL